MTTGILGGPRSKSFLDADSLDPRATFNVKVFEREEEPPITKPLDKAIYCTGWDGTIVLEANRKGEWKVVKTTGAT